MTKAKADMKLARRRRKGSLWRMALAICGAHGVRASIRQEVASEIASNAYRIPADKLQGFAHRTARRRLAADLGLRLADIPASRDLSHAVAQYEYERRMREIWQLGRRANEDWVGGFDYHSRQFAIENGVCPRCSTPGDFDADRGACACGYRYG